MSRTAGPKKQWLEDLHKVLAEERRDLMSEDNDRSVGRGDTEPINHDLEEMGFFFDPATKRLVG
jgi:hypothetical protein